MAIKDGFEKQKKYIAKDDGFLPISSWTHSDSVEFNDNKTLTEKIETINNNIETIGSEVNGMLPLTGGTVTGTLKLTKTQDASGTADNNPALIIGGENNQKHIEIDNNEIIGKEDATTPGNIFINPEGGEVCVNGKLVARYTARYPTLVNNQVLVASGTDGEIKTSGFTISTSVPANAKFTDTNNAVTQTNTTTNANYRLLFSATADNTTRTEGARKSGDLAYNPSTKLLVVPNITVTNHINCNGDMVLQTGFVCNHGYTAVSGDADTTVNKKYSYLAFRPNQQTRKGGNDIRVYNDYVATAENLAIKLWNDGHIESENIELFAGTPYIDFHRNNSTADYTGRIINRDEGYIDFYKTGATLATLRAASFDKQSSVHIKTNIEDITDDEAKKLLKLRPVSFDYINGDSNQCGLIAEEVMEILPNTVSIPDDYTEFDPNEPWNTPSIDYSKYVPYLIKMIQIQQQEIDELKRR